MTILTAANAGYRQTVELSLAMNGRLGYEPRVIDLDGFTAPAHYKAALAGTWRERDGGPLPHKPEIVLAGMNEIHGDVVWMDADAFAIRRFDGVFDQDFDVAVTLRRPDERKSKPETVLRWGYTNSGVMFFRNNQAARGFVGKWALSTAQTRSKSDQEGLNVLLLSVGVTPQIGTVLDIEGCRVRLLDSEEYNWFYWPELPLEKTRIVHLTSNRRQHWLKWLAQFRMRQR